MHGGYNNKIKKFKVMAPRNKQTFSPRGGGLEVKTTKSCKNQHNFFPYLYASNFSTILLLILCTILYRKENTLVFPNLSWIKALYDAQLNFLHNNNIIATNMVGLY